MLIITSLIAKIFWMSTLRNFFTQAEWTYNGNDEAIEPSRWGDVYPECNGIRNSPIDIETENVVSTPLANPWLISGWDTNSIWNITYQQSSVSFIWTTGSPRIGLSGGYLPGNYSMVEMHFHWGRNNSWGSEHTINGQSYPMELHCVHLGTKYKTINEALLSNDSVALAVLGFMFQVQKDDNPALKRLIHGINETLHSYKTNIDYNLGNLKDFLSESTDGGFWRYEGSLTTPSCKQQVVWTVFSRDIKLSEAQIQVLRSFRSDQFGTERYRPTQPLNNRSVWYYEPSRTQEEAEKSTTKQIKSSEQQVTEPTKEQGAENSAKPDEMRSTNFTIPRLIVKEPPRPHRTDLENPQNSNQPLVISLQLLIILQLLLTNIFDSV